MALRDWNLDLGQGGEWSRLAKTLTMAALAAAVAGLGYHFDLSARLDALDAERRTETELRAEFAAKQRVVANIDAHRAQLHELEARLAQLLKQLPTRTEMPSLLEDISNLGRANGLVFQQFKPLDEIPREFYAAKPILLKAQGNYHQFGAFLGSVAALARIVTLESVTLSGQAVKDVNRESAEPLTIEATLQTYRYLEDEPSVATGASHR